MRSKLILLQDKATKGKQITVKLADLQALEEDARRDGLRMPVFTLTFEGRGRYYMVPEHWFQELKGEHEG